MDSCNDNDDNAHIISNSVPYEASETKSIESTVLSCIMNSSYSDYSITVTDVTNVIEPNFNY